MSNCKNCLINAIIIYFMTMYLLVSSNPESIYDSEGKIKKWGTVNINNINSLHNIYVYSILCAVLSHYIAREI